MLYKKNGADKLDQSLFRNPGSEYRGAPFWAWNCRLEQKELEWQMEVMKKMGFGGIHMHVRTGLDTPYLGDEFMGHIRGCVNKAKQENMLAWLYDEDRWPSGAAGGLVTRDKRYRARYLLFTPTPYCGMIDKIENSTAAAGRTENGELLACYDVELDRDGYLVSYRTIGAEEPALHHKWYAYLEQPLESGWYNNQTYVNTLDKKAMDRFIEVTYEAYNREISEEFDGVVPAIFTDEPQFSRKSTLRFATEQADVKLPWTDDLPETFAAAYGGEDLLAGLPELVWERADRVVSVVRYHYHDHVCERFTQAFADNCGAWCREHGIALTGHMMEEPTLHSQTAALGEAMRAYRGFDLPGIDMLCAGFEFTTAKQTQSAVHQFGREGMLSEIYGVTNWDFDFRGHKLHGDWQAALGVSIRVPHLSWVSMAGEAKRDYPASINYQSPWWEKYSLVEDHFARLNTAMTRGKPIVKVGVIHPVESYWLHWGPAEQTALVRDEMDQNFQDLTKWLLFGGIDFNFISESLLPELCPEGGVPLRVGEMAYDAILVPGCETLRTTTLERLEAFSAAGGRLIFAGQIPTLADAVPSERAGALARDSIRIPLSKGAVLDALREVRTVEIRNQSGALTEDLLYQLRQDGDGRWLFIAHGAEPYNMDVCRFQDLRIRLDGQWIPKVYNTLTGEVESVGYQTDEGGTMISKRLYDYDSLLLWLEPTSEDSQGCGGQTDNIFAGREVRIPSLMDYSLSEPNAMLLDQAEYRLDDGPWMATEEILRLDNACRAALGWPSRKEAFAQPWVVPEEPVTHQVSLRFRIESDDDRDGVMLAIEDARNLRITFNGQPVESVPTGWYTDKSIQTLPLPGVRRGINVLEVQIPFGKRTNIEWCYLVGDFGVEVTGRRVRMTALPEKLSFGDITRQGLPFYGGNVTYRIPVQTHGGRVLLRAAQYRGALLEASLDGGEKQPLIYPPYVVDLGTPDAGVHTVDLTLFGHRRNGFGPVHLTDLKDRWIGPEAWRSTGERWCYDYRLTEEGILTTPVIVEK